MLITKIGTKAASKLIAQETRVTLTRAYAIHQVLIAAALGADYIASYLDKIAATDFEQTARRIADQDLSKTLAQ